MPNLKYFIEKMSDFYDDQRIVFCPVLNSWIKFTRNGFNHLLYKSNGKKRNVSEQYLKLLSLKYAPEVIRNCSNITETREKEYSTKGKLKKYIEYELTHEIDKEMKIRVVIIKSKSGEYQFRSVMPHDHKSKKRLYRRF